MKINKYKIKQFLKKREFLYDFGGDFLDGFLPKNHPIVLDPIKRKKLRIYIGLSTILFIVLLSLVLFLKNYLIVVYPYLYFYLIILFFSYLFNLITKFKYFEYFLITIIVISISLNFYFSTIEIVFPPYNYTSLISFVLLLHFLYNRWISLLYIIFIIFFSFYLILKTQNNEFNLSKLYVKFRYFYDFVITIIIAWFMLEIYENLKDELEKKLKETHIAREKDLELAREIQSQFYPSIPRKKNYYINYLIQPYDKVSGDYLDIIENDSNIWVILGDVTGHGLQSAMLTMQINTLLNYLLVEKNLQDIKKIYFELNSQYYKILQKLNIKNFAKLTILKLENNGRVEISGNTNLLYYFNSYQKKIVKYKEPSPLLGMINFKSTNEINFKEIKLFNNDILFLCSDGMIEIVKKDKSLLKEEFFEQLLEDFFYKNYHDKNNLKIEFFIKNIEKQIGHLNFIDDITSIIIQWKK